MSFVQSIGRTRAVKRINSTQSLKNIQDYCGAFFFYRSAIFHPRLTLKVFNKHTNSLVEKKTFDHIIPHKLAVHEIAADTQRKTDKIMDKNKGESYQMTFYLCHLLLIFHTISTYSVPKLAQLLRCVCDR